jgi:hypothetical protein
MSEMSHVLVHTTRFDPTKRVARKVAPGNRRHVILSNGVRVGRRGVRSKPIPMKDAKDNAELLAASVERGVLEVKTPDHKVMTPAEIRGLATGKAPAAKPAPKPEEPKKVVLEVKDEVKVVDEVEPKAEPDDLPKVSAPKAKSKKTSKKGKE